MGEEALSLEVVEGPDAGRRVGLDGPLEIGRGEGVGFRLTDRLTSRSHARVVPAGSGATVEDLGSSNGTFVNSDEVHGTSRLGPGDHLMLGVTTMELRTAREVAERPSAVHTAPPPLAVPVRAPDYVPEPLREEHAAEREPAEREPAGHELDSLLDARTKGKARTAPLAVFVLVVLVVLVYLATR
jgi:pSer/pThr/pTyr-binding forkhead associated (FHA) protein